MARTGAESGRWPVKAQPHLLQHPLACPMKTTQIFPKPPTLGTILEDPARWARRAVGSQPILWMRNQGQRHRDWNPGLLA